MNAAALVVSIVALAVSTAVAIHQIRLGSEANRTGRRLLDLEESRHEWEQRTAVEAADIQRRMLQIESNRHLWEQEARASEQDLARSAEVAAQAANFTMSFGYRDSARTWGRVIARNNGPADASDVQLTVWALNSAGQRVEPGLVNGADYGSAPTLRAGESVHVGVSFSMQGPSAEDLRYTLTWTDGRGERSDEGQVPVV